MKTLNTWEAVKSAFMAAVGCAMVFGLPAAIIHSGWISARLDKVLQLEVNSRFTGEAVQASFMDPMYDDHGEGAVTYPRHQAFEGEGLLDIVSYTVHQPVTGAVWTEEPDYWQLTLHFTRLTNPFDAPGGFGLPVIHVYLDIDGAESGSTETAEARVELVTFDEEHPWDFLVHVDGYAEKGTIVSADGEYEGSVTLIPVVDENKIQVRISLDHPLLKQVLDGRPTFHYVMVGGYSQMSRGHFATIKERPTTHRGGGASSKLTPRIYDYVAPEGRSQEDILRAHDLETYTYAKLYPLHVDPASSSQDRAVCTPMARQELEGEAVREQEAQQALAHERIQQLLSEPGDCHDLGEAYFEAGDYETSEETLDRCLADAPKAPIALAYKGSLVAMRGGRADSASDAVELVYEGFRYLDQAVEFAVTDEEIVTTRINRGSVGVSVPEEVFNTSEQASQDFLAAIEALERSGGDPDTTALCYYQAAVAYERLAKPDLARIYYTRASTYTDLPAELKLGLLERGYAAR